jgi:hypothetical protein
LRQIREQAAWERIESRFKAEHGMTIHEYGSRYGPPKAWLKSWQRELDASLR